MSSVVISGNTSGTITLDAPAVAGTTTLTLPATSGTVLTTASTFGGTGPAFSAYQSTAQTGIAVTTWTKITLTTENFDTNNNYASSRFTPNVTGYYQINGSVTLTGASTSFFVISAIYKNGAIYSQGQPSLGNSNYYPTSVVGTVLYLNGSTDYVELYGFGSASGVWSTYNTLENTNFTGALVRSA
jgi:hypothetical protein